MTLTKNDVIKIAKLARISLSDEEVEMFQKDLSKVFAYVENLMSIDVSGVEEISQVTGLVNVQRNDVAVLAENQSLVLAQVPEVKDDYVKVKTIL